MDYLSESKKSHFAASLANINFDSLSLDDKIRICIEKGIMKIFLWISNPHDTSDRIPHGVAEIDFDKIDDLEFKLLKFENLEHFRASKNEFRFGSHYLTSCHKYKVMPSIEYKDEILRLFFDSYGETFETPSNSIDLLLNYEDEKSQLEKVKIELKQLLSHKYNYIKWYYDHDEQTINIDNHDKLMNDCYDFQLTLLTKAYYYPPEIIEKDPILTFSSELGRYYTITRLIDYLNFHKNKIESSRNTNEVDEPDSSSHSTTYDQLYIMDQLGMLLVFEEDGRTKTHHYQLLSKILGKSSENIRKYWKKLEDKNPSQDRRNLNIKLDNFIKHG